MSDVVTTILQLLGLLILPAAVALIYVPLALIIVAAELFAVGAYLERR